ncbi:Morphogenetic regulator of filamentous growth protein 1 [Candida viswanathii]|uniref:Morphogenetic regulator of filamentous growth protein 1 n=1 Tax=Candida viswanathii TaxID=5486 RepID=A0A367YML4_9ASCO|nr:Morphogenetic regulator of filamentous growth protein 1 [Candida viswanathii]
MSVRLLDMNTNHNNQGIPNQQLMMNGNNSSGSQQQQQQLQQQQQQPPPPPPGQQQMFNQTPQMQYLQGPQPGPGVRNSSVPPPQQQQQMGQPQMQQQRFNMNMPQQMSQQQMMAAQQQLQQQQAALAAAAAAAASGRPVPQKNATFNGTPTNGQPLQLGGNTGATTNTNANNNTNNANSKTVSYNPNGLMSGLPSANLQPQSASTSRVHTPHMGHQPQPFVSQQLQMQPQQMQPQQGPNHQPGQPLSGPPPPNQLQMLKKGNSGNSSVNATPKNGGMGTAPGGLGALQQHPAFPQATAQQFGVPPNSANSNLQLQAPFGPQPQPQQGQHPTVSGRSPILRQTLHANGPQDMNNSVEQYQQEINTRIIKRNLGNAAIVRILDLIDFVSSQLYENLSNIEFWTRTIPGNFLPSAILKFNFLGNSSTGASLHDITGLNFNFLQLNADSNNPNAPHQFELNTSTAPRFFVSCVQAKSILRCSIALSGSKCQVLNNGSTIIVSKIELHFNYQDGSNSIARGTVKILMSRDLRIEWIDLNCADYQGNISMSALEAKLKSPVDSKKDVKKQKESLDEMISNSQAVQWGATSGIDARSMRILQVGDIMTSMKSLMEFSMMNNIASPLRSLELLITSQGAQQVQALQAQMAAQAHFQATNAAGANSFIGAQQLQAKKTAAAATVANSNTNNSVSSPSPRTINADEPKKKRKPSMSSLGDNKRRK